MNDSIDSGNLYVGGYLPLIRKYSVTHMHGPTVYVKEGLPSAQNLSVENSQDSYLFSTSFTSFSVLLLFPLSISSFEAILPNTVEILIQNIC